jgi:PAS domain S-box-containing protein/putative nucleotidyltransferase with HDIG domain
MDFKTNMRDGRNLLTNLKLLIEEVMDSESSAGNTCRALHPLLDEIKSLLDSVELGERQWQDAFDAVQDPIFLHDQDFRIIRANRAYARQAGMAIQEVIGKPYWEIFPKGDGPLPQCAGLLECQDNDAQSEEITLDNGDTYLSRGFAVHNAQGDYVYSVHVMEDITEKRRLQEALAENAERYQNLFQGAPDAVFLADAETGQLIDANPAAEHLIGRPREEIITLHQSQLHPPHAPAVDIFRKHVRAGSTDALLSPREIPVLHADGREIPTEISAQVFQLNGRSVIQGVFRDISARKAVESKLRQHAQILSQIHDSVISTDLDGIVTSWNEGAARMLGYSEAEALGKSITFIYPEEELTFLAEQVMGPVMEKGSHEVEVRIRRKSGETFFAQASLSLLRNDQGTPVGIIGYSHDITQRKHAEDQLKEASDRLHQSLNLLKDIVESVPIRVFWKDRDLRYLGCNTLFAHDAGQEHPDDLMGKTDFDMGWSEQAELYRQDDQQVMDSGIPKLGYEEPQTTPEGKTLWLRTSKVPLLDENREVIGVLGIYDDITAQKEAEQELLLSESRLKEAQSVSQLGSWELDLVQNALWWSDENYRIFGAEPGTSNTYETFLNTVHPDDRDFVNEAYTGSVEKKTPYNIEHRLLLPDGTVKWVHERCKTFYDDDGTPLRSTGTTLDITERKMAEAQASRLGRILDNSINEIYVFDATSLRFELVNAGALQNLGYSMAEMAEMTPLDLKPEFSTERFENLVAPLRQDERRMQVFETVHRRKNGSLYPVEVHLQYSSKEVQPVFVATILDITERRKADERLRRSEAGLAEAQRIAHLGNWELDIVNNRLTWSDEIYRIFEVDRQHFGATYETYLEAIHPDDRDQVDQSFRQSIKTKTPYEITHRLCMADGRIKYVHGVCETHFDEAGHPLRSVGTVQDITQQHLTEQALNRTNRALKAISSCNSVLVHASHEDELLNNMCHVIIHEGGYRFTWIGLVEDGADKCVRPAAHAGFEDGYLDQLNVTYDDSAFGRGPAGCAVRHGKPQVVNDTLNDPSFTPWREAAAERGYRSVLALPLIDDRGEVFAVLSINAEEPNAFDKESMKLMEELAADLAFGILALRTRDERNHYLREHQKSNERYKQVLVDTIRAISLTVEKRDPYTAGHQNRVALLSVAIGRELGMEDDRLKGLRLGAMIHDIGKISVPAEILNRPGRLSEAEFTIIKSHSQVGYDIIKDVQFPWPVADMVVQHHERLDGSGYPKGLKAGAIIPEARILAVADVVEAITAHRPYRPAVGLEKALLEIEANRGKLYDAEVVDACLHLIRDKGFEFEENGKS